MEPLVLKPCYVNKDIDANLSKLLRSTMEGKYSPQYGVTLAITQITRYSDGVIDVSDASVHYLVTFEALMFNLFQGEIALCRVAEVQPESVKCVCGPVVVHIHRQNLRRAVTFENSLEQRPRFVGADVVIEEGTLMRVRIISQSAGVESAVHIGELVSVVDDQASSAAAGGYQD